MTNRVNQNTWLDGSNFFVAHAVPWEAAGEFNDNAVIKDAEGVFAGILVEASDGGGDIEVEVWDSPDATLTNDICVASVRIASTTAYTQDSFGSLAGLGIHCHNGIYVKKVSGDCVFYVFYR